MLDDFATLQPVYVGDSAAACVGGRASVQVDHGMVLIDDNPLDVEARRRIGKFGGQRRDGSRPAIDHSGIVLNIVFDHMFVERAGNVALRVEHPRKVRNDGAVPFGHRRLFCRRE